MPIKSKHPLVLQLVELRKAKNITQQKLSVCSGLNKNAITIWENGIAYPNLMTFEACANALGYEVRLIKKRRAMNARVMEKMRAKKISSRKLPIKLAS